MARLVLLLALLLAWPPAARALCLGPVCSCGVSAGTLNFGSHNPLSGNPTDSTATVSVQCGGVAGLLIPYEVALSAGGSGLVGARRLSSGGHTLAYGLYGNAARTTVWGDASGGAVMVDSILLSILGLAPPRLHTVYGRIPAGPTNAVPGSYTDTITLTLTYF
jgi:spore coat protein U-like protein